MRRMILAVCALAMALLALPGCSQQVPESPQDGGAPTPEVVYDGTPTAGKTVSPLPSGIDPENLGDCTVEASFEKGDAYVDDTGAMQLRMKIYTYDLYDMVDISMLKVGDKLSFCRQDVEVTSLERDGDGTVVINGGLENGGIELVSNESTAFYARGTDDMKQYYELGEATVPVSPDFEFEDASDLEKGPRTYYPGDFLTDDAGIDYHFVPGNTMVTIQGGYVVHMERVYNP